MRGGANVAPGKVAALTSTTGGSEGDFALEGRLVASEGLTGRSLSALEFGVGRAVGTNGGSVGVAVSVTEVAVAGRAEVVEDGVVLGIGEVYGSLSSILAESSNSSASVGGGGGEVTRETVEETGAVAVGAGATLGETSLADSVNAETVVTVGVGGASGTSDTTEIGSGFELLRADRVDGVDAVTLNIGGVGGSSRVDEEVVGALRLVRGEGSVTVNDGTGETTVTGLGSNDAGEGEDSSGGDD